MHVNRIWILIGKKLTGEASSVDLAELESLMSGRIDNTYPLRELEEMWHSGKAMPENVSDFKLNEKWQHFKNSLPENKLSDDQAIIPISRKRFNLKWISAACLLLVSACALWFYTAKLQSSDTIATTIKSPKGSISEVTLPDGTRVWLNGGSVLTYKKHFGEKLREVSLMGEAYFDVIKDASHPFIVNTSSIRLKVLGTAFNVRSFNNDKTSEASLIRGSVEITLLNSPDKKIILKPSEKLTIRNQILPVISAKQESKPQHVIDQVPLISLSNIHFQEKQTLPTETQWMEKKLAFTSERFEDLAFNMERYYGVTIRFKDEALKGLVFSGSFKEESIYEVMKALQLTGNFHFKISGNLITIYN